MISPEVLRRFPFFANVTDDQLKTLAMIAEEQTLKKGEEIFKEGESAKDLYILTDGSFDLFIKSEESFDPTSKREFAVGEINQGEIFGISSLIEPYTFNVTARSSADCTFIAFEGSALKAYMGKDPQFSCFLMTQAAKLLLERLYWTRVQLAAAWA